MELSEDQTGKYLLMTFSVLSILKQEDALYLLPFSYFALERAI